MATITLKNIPDALYARLRSSAEDHRRSINREAIVCLETALADQPVDVESILANVREVRSSLGAVFLTDRDLKRARQEGRP
jgi:plasmid stability protein